MSVFGFTGYNVQTDRCVGEFAHDPAFEAGLRALWTAYGARHDAHAPKRGLDSRGASCWVEDGRVVCGVTYYDARDEPPETHHIPASPTDAFEVFYLQCVLGNYYYNKDCPDEEWLREQHARMQTGRARRLARRAELDAMGLEFDPDEGMDDE